MARHRKPKIEIGTIEHQGRKFSAMGSVVDSERGVVVGYVGKGTVPGHASHARPLTTWKGEQIGVIWPTSSWKTPRSYVSSHSYAYDAIVDGEKYHGRGQGEGMVVRLKRYKKQR
jgi:hypothetical protein